MGCPFHKTSAPEIRGFNRGRKARAADSFGARMGMNRSPLAQLTHGAPTESCANRLRLDLD
jgi:hypothetical protein